MHSLFGVSAIPPVNGERKPAMEEWTYVACCFDPKVGDRYPKVGPTVKQQRHKAMRSLRHSSRLSLNLYIIYLSWLGSEQRAAKIERRSSQAEQSREEQHRAAINITE